MEISKFYQGTKAQRLNTIADFFKSYSVLNEYAQGQLSVQCEEAIKSLRQISFDLKE